MKLKSEAQARLPVEDDSPESGTGSFAAARLAAGVGASGSCTDWARPLVAKLRQIRAITKRKHTILGVQRNPVTENFESGGFIS